MTTYHPLHVSPAHHKAIRHAHAAAVHAHTLAKALLADYPAGEVPLAIRDLETMAAEVAGYYTTSLAVLTHEADPDLRRAMDPTRKDRAA